ncbi:hypothetical protein PX699_13345 [Sphingobium sp. H39-3-25]|uniref:hypothetical protein n=1 Tax=Sphingobium arseniciresistens TaxID=3030834 RepID=UPI0023B8E008|nr:hypothetical protein [Sphingobium arseniciresistens]
MPDLAAAFSEIAMGFSALLGAPYWPARIIDQADVVFDAGGSIVSSGEPVMRTCQVQVDAATDAMRGQDGFVEGDRRMLVLAGSLSGVITTDARIEVLSGPFAGLWMVESVARDPASIGWELRGRAA